jgi:hypothetical protein
MSRTRLIRPSFFTDERMASLSLPTRLAYIGLWTLADDDGYFERRPVEIAAALFGYESPTRRLKRVDKALEELAGAGRVKWLECGDHGHIPTLAEHAAQGGRKSYTSRDKHRRECGLRLFSTRDTDRVRTGTDSSGPVSVLGSGSVLESGRGAPRSLNELATETGGFVAALAGKKA